MIESAKRAFGPKPEAKADKYSSQEMLNKVQEYFYSDKELSRTFEDFIVSKAHIMVVDVMDSSSEFKLEYTALYEEYKSLFESRLSSYIENELESSIVKFYSALKNKIDTDPESPEAIFAQILNSVADFDVFMMMMKEAARSLRGAKK